MDNKGWCEKNCPYFPDCGGGICNFVLALLQEQKAVKPVHIYGHNLCGCCGTILHETRKRVSRKLTSTKAYYCPNCGKAVKWE